MHAGALLRWHLPNLHSHGSGRQKLVSTSKLEVLLPKIKAMYTITSKKKYLLCVPLQ